MISVCILYTTIKPSNPFSRFGDVLLDAERGEGMNNYSLFFSQFSSGLPWLRTLSKHDPCYLIFMATCSYMTFSSQTECAIFFATFWMLHSSIALSYIYFYIQHLLSLSLSLYLSIYLSISLSLSIYLSIYLSINLSFTFHDLVLQIFLSLFVSQSIIWSD